MSKKRKIKLKWMIIAVVIVALIGTVSPKDDDENPNKTTEAFSSVPTESIDTESATEVLEELPPETETEILTEPPKTINDDVDISFFENVQNDVTGNWRLASVATMKEIQEYALEYCNAYFKSDDEVHAVINFSLNTTNRLAKITSDILDVTVHSYVDKEEQNAKDLFSGTVLANYQINTSTGEVTEVPLEPEPEEAAAADPPDNQEEEINTPAPESAPESSNPDAGMVWVSATGSKYHSIPDCGRMDPSKARQVSKDEAAGSGLTPCSKCY